MTAPDPPGWLTAALAEAMEEGSHLDLGRPTALGWATVELDRAETELAGLLRLAADAFGAGEDSVALSARCRIAHDALGEGLALAILEPSTEGRLAETLARHGEGPVAIWYTAVEPVAVETTAARPGPFGPERLVRPGPAGRRRWFLVTTGPGTIAP